MTVGVFQKNDRGGVSGKMTVGVFQKNDRGGVSKTNDRGGVSKMVIVEAFHKCHCGYTTTRLNEPKSSTSTIHCALSLSIVNITG
eukprot:COSAG02_NODE_4743_length_5032_cov_7.739307_3_plen_85_part_00